MRAAQIIQLKQSEQDIGPKTQFEIERRSCGQSMTTFRFFSCGGQNN